MRRRAMRQLVLVLLSATALGRCTCEPEDPNPPLPAVGELRAVVVEGGVELRLDSADARVRVLSVNVKLRGARATALSPLGPIDLAEGALDAPKESLVVVLADTRRIPLPEGAIARLETDAAPTAVELSDARAVDESGAERSVTLVVP
jgi:hypothetical protein